MKIKSVEIYGYGQFVKRTVVFNQHITQIFGENEAGKSTLQAFIHSILFGFPTRKENEPRLEPRMGNQYGGRVTLILDDNTEVDVERVKGSAQGDVKVYLPNGAIKDEAWLKHQLNYIDKRTYQDIFSFNVLGLQDIHKHMTENQLQNFLMQAGALGSTEFIGMRDLIHKKKQSLYKKSGQQPEINQRVAELKEVELQIRDASTQLESYQRLVETRDKSSDRLETVKQNLDQLTHFFEEKQKELALHDQVQEWKALEAELNIEPVTFPEQGIDRYEAAKLQKQQLERDIGLREEKYNQLKHENHQRFVPSNDVVNEIDTIAKQEEEIKQYERDLNQMVHDIEYIQREIEGLKSNIGWQEIHDDVDTSDVQKSYMSDTLKDKRDNTYQVKQYENMLDEHVISHQSHETELAQLQEELVPEETFEQKKVYEKRSLELNEKRNLFMKMKEAFEVEQQQKKKQQNVMRSIFIVIALLCAGMAIYAFLAPAMLYGAIFAVLACVFFIAIFMIKTKEVGHNERFSEEIRQLEEEVKQLEATYDLNFDLSDQYQLRDRIVQREQNLAISTKKQQHLQQQLENAKLQQQESIEKVDGIRHDLHVSDKLSDELLLDALQTIQSLKEQSTLLTKTQEKKAYVTEKLDAFYRDAEQILVPHFQNFNRMSVFHDVREWLEHAKSETTKFQHNQEQIQLLEKEVKHLKQRLHDNNEVIDKLFSFTGALDEETYYRHHDRFVNYTQSLSRYHDLTQFLENQDYGYEKSTKVSDKTTAQIEAEHQELEAQIDDYNDKYLTLQSEVSDLTAQINHMETDNTLRHLKHKYQLLRTQLNEIAEDWAALSYLEQVVDAHIKQIKDERLPKVVHEATDIYTHLTDGQYTQVTYENEKVMVRHKDGQMYHPVELSQSTKELLYFALRISLIKILKPYYSLPIIIDDAFVHFDATRKKRMMAFLKTMPDNYQILYFTCNQDTSITAKQSVILNRLEK
ncbi:DNA repair protein Rad50 [Staphylococcus muscae]|uniref:DNA double-strand break repair Rad50 ATPase n=1 Tax=Staphylococcus muscae TaxID=1294 RepID=A0A240C4M5_9STAP|nr:AAA family ATPase [Staphylococcus muscae]AVQ33346.1 DNA repair protein Rad50 [Staphylococcus muscae]PNZ02451.1 DNA repair protein Rad50 [Staphylococcus muscae]GGA94359.1 DNA double-strand break repair Rad50 ATPase [Staphylococcus muscae]SNW03061.1 DNA double-strand break repair rad50 ATPase [Staphylococcus muscae]